MAGVGACDAARMLCLRCRHMLTQLTTQFMVAALCSECCLRFGGVTGPHALHGVAVSCPAVLQLSSRHNYRSGLLPRT
jgi:hypothetical protein